MPCWKACPSSFPASDALVECRFRSEAGEVHVAVRRERRRQIDADFHSSPGRSGRRREIYFRAQTIQLASVIDARALGISAVFQEFSLVPQLTVEENICSSAPSRRSTACSTSGTASPSAREILEAPGFPLNAADSGWPICRAPSSRWSRSPRRSARSRRCSSSTSPPPRSPSARPTGSFALIEQAKARGRRHHLHHSPDGRDPPHRRSHHGAARRTQGRHSRCPSCRAMTS